MEIAQKHAAGRLLLQGGLGPRTWFAQLMRRGGLQLLDITAEMALGAYELPEPFHKDPADRLVVAAARILEVPIVTIDRNILAYAAAGHVEALAYQ